MFESPWLRPADVAGALDVSLRTVQQWCDEGRVQAIRIRGVWRIHAQCLGVPAAHLPHRPTYRINEVAGWLRVSRQTVWRLIAASELCTCDVRGCTRIPRESLLAFVARAADVSA